MNTIGVLAQGGSWYLRDLEIASQNKCRIQQIPYPDLEVTLGRFSQELASLPVGDSKAGWDAILVRSMPIGSLEQVVFRMDALRCWENQGVPVFNSSLGLEIAIDKALTLIRFEKAGLPFPPTAVFQKADSALNWFKGCDCPVVVKPVFGGEGRGLILVEDIEMAYRVFKTLEQTRSVIYCQKFLADVIRDIRILLIGSQFYAVRRQNEGSWITNAAQGGTGVPYEPTPNELDLAFRAAKASENEIVGVDLLVTKDGDTHLIEVNAVPGWKMLGQVRDVDIASEILNHLLKKIARG